MFPDEYVAGIACQETSRQKSSVLSCHVLHHDYKVVKALSTGQLAILFSFGTILEG